MSFTLPPIPCDLWLDNTKDYYNRLQPMSELDQEHCILLTLVNDNRLVGQHIIGIGGLDTVFIDLRILFQRVILDKCDKFLIAHNHTDGCGVFSEDDINSAIRINYVSCALGVEFIDSLLFPFQKKPSSMKKQHPELFSREMLK